MPLHTPLHTPLATDSWLRIVAEWARTDRTWLILPQDPVRGEEAVRLSFRDLFEGAVCAARGLRGAGGREGERVVIALDSGPEFCFGFFGAIFARMIPVPFPPAHALPSADAYGARLEQVSTNCGARYVLGDTETLAALRDRPALAARVWTHEQLLVRACTRELPPAAQLSDPALIQYTSGTTGGARGVQLSHGNLLYNVHGAVEAMGGFEPGDVTCGWLPMHHDMGLIGMMLKGVYSGVPLVMLGPRDFITRPEAWLWAISRYRAVSSAAPNFAYMLCTRIREEKLTGIDLRSWRLALNGSESVERATVEAFLGRFARHGFQAGALTPGYGLAEDTVACCFARAGARPAFDPVIRRALHTRGVAEPSAAQDDATRFVASVGEPLPGQQVRIVDDAGQELPERAVGEIQVAGPCVMMGYHNDAAATRASLSPDGFLRTGDRGYVAAGKLHVLGRTRDTIKRAGHLYDALEVRAATREVADVKGLVASFGVANPRTGTEDLVVVAETRLTEAAERDELRTRIARAVRGRLGAQPDVIELVGPGAIPRTTSGKISNHEARERYLSRQGS